MSILFSFMDFVASVQPFNSLKVPSPKGPGRAQPGRALSEPLKGPKQGPLRVPGKAIENAH